MIGADIPFAKSHRHYSHLLAVYPLYEVTGRTPDERALIERSLAHWVGFEGALQGYTFTGAASMSALLGKGEDALGYLGELMTRFIQPNTMYQESGPVIETPLSAAQSLHDMVCQSWGGVIRVFPALPAAWTDLVVHDFRTQGAFLLGARREDGATRWVRLLSEAGAPCVVRHGIAGPVDVRDGRGRPLPHIDVGDGAVQVALRKGESALITARGDRPDLTVAPVRPNEDAPRWGCPASDGSHRLRPRPLTDQPLPMPATCRASTMRPSSMMLVEVKVSLVEMSAALIRKDMKNRTAEMMASMVPVPSIV